MKRNGCGKVFGYAKATRDSNSRHIFEKLKKRDAVCLGRSE
jgi:hypothetical protein